MAKAASSWLLLGAARKRVAAKCLSEKYAEVWLLEQLAARLLRWRRQALVPNDPYAEKVFWSDPHRLTVYWDDHWARCDWWPEHGKVAYAYGVQVCEQDLDLLLAAEFGERGAVERRGPAKPAEREQMQPKDWFAQARRDHRQRRGEGRTAYRDRLHALMSAADDVTKVWTPENMYRRLSDPL